MTKNKEQRMTHKEKYPKWAMLLDKEALKLYVSDGDQWLEIAPSFDLKALDLYAAHLKTNSENC